MVHKHLRPPFQSYICISPIVAMGIWGILVTVRIVPDGGLCSPPVVCAVALEVMPK